MEKAKQFTLYQVESRYTHDKDQPSEWMAEWPMSGGLARKWEENHQGGLPGFSERSDAEQLIIQRGVGKQDTMEFRIVQIDVTFLRTIIEEPTQ